MSGILTLAFVLLAAPAFAQEAMTGDALKDGDYRTIG